MSNEPDLFGYIEECTGDNTIKGMVHIGDPGTSIEAAQQIKEYKTKLHGLVLQALEIEGPLTDAELEQLPQFVAYGPSTIRKRRSELYQAGKIEINGERPNERGYNMKIWRIK